MAYDYVIIGGGSAGCVLANRLSADAGVKVALLEAGPRDKNFLIHMPAGYPALMKTGIVDWGYHTEPQAGMNGRALFWPRGRVLGGSSSVNAMIYIRGVPSDYDLWAQLGNRGWSWDDVLPYFKKAETYLPGADAHHGSGGPLKVSRPGISNPLNLAWIEAGKQAGLPLHERFQRREPGGLRPHRLHRCRWQAGERRRVLPDARLGAAESHRHRAGSGDAHPYRERPRGWRRIRQQKAKT